MKTTRINFTTVKMTLLALSTSLFLTAAAQAETFTVDRADDANVSGCTEAANDCTLRGAIARANQIFGFGIFDDTINFAAALGGQTITVTGGNLEISNSSVSGAVTINGLTPSGGVTVAGSNNNNSVVFYVNRGEATINNLTIRNGGYAGIFNSGGKLTLNNSTVSNNSGRGIDNSNGTVELFSSTVSNNSGIGIFTNNGTVRLENTIIANSGGGDCSNSGGSVSGFFSLIEDGSCVAVNGVNTFSGDPNLGPLQNNDGTQTHALLSGSIAIDKGSSTLTTDQRGFPRPIDDPNTPNVSSNLADIGAFEVQTPPLVLTVDTNNDNANLSTCSDAVPDDCSLRGAIARANATATNDTINYPAAALAGQSVLNAGQLQINNVGALTINGNGTLYGGDGASNDNRVFLIRPGATVTINNLTIRNGRVTNSGGGGGIYNNQGNLTLNNSTVSNNSAINYGGGGIYNNQGNLTLNNSTVSNNTAGSGGGIYNNGTTTLNNSTVSGNTVSFNGGGIGNDSEDGTVKTLTLNSSTVSNNSATRSGGGIYNIGSISFITLNNSIVANSTSGGDCVRGVGNNGTVNASYSLIEDGLTCVNGTNSNNLTGDPNLGPLQNNLGATETHALLRGSIAVDKGNSTFTTDQRGFPRPYDDPNSPNGTGNLSDIGAFELELIVNPATLPNVLIGTPYDQTLTALGGTAPYNFAVTNGALPTGLTLSTGGTLSGTPTAAGIYNFTVTATDPNGITGSRAYTITIFAPQTFVVDTTADDPALTACTSAPNDCSLRGAIAAANASPAADTIAFDIPSCANNTCTIRLSGGELQINSTSTAGKLTITNTGSTMKIVVSGNNTSRVFFVSDRANLTLDRLTVTGGNGAGIFAGAGGAILNFNGTLTLTNSTVSGNTAANGSGGAILNNSGTLTLTNSTVSGNTATGSGGGIIINSGTATLTNSTVAGNAATNGSGGGISNFGAVNLSNTIVAGNTAANFADIRGTVTSQGYNLIGNNSGATITVATGDQIGTNTNPIDPKLASLADNLGPTQTRALLSGSPAIDQGNSNLMTDQRGSTRPIDDPNSPNGTGNLSDIGAFEVKLAPTAASVLVGGRVMVGKGRGLINATVTLTASNGETRTARTNPFGYYRFADIAVGQTLIFRVSHKHYRFSPQVVSVMQQLSELDFIANESFLQEVK